MSAQQLPRKRFLQNLRGRVLGDENAVTLVVGDIARWASDGRTMPDVRELTYAEFSDFSPSLLEMTKPDVILSPLVTETFDAFQVISVLDASEFTGRYRAISQHLPNLAMIRQEIKSNAPTVDFEIVVMPPTLVSVD